MTVSTAVPALRTVMPRPSGTLVTVGRLSAAALTPVQITALPISASAKETVPVPVISLRSLGSMKGNTSAVPAGRLTKAPLFDEAMTATRESVPGEPPSKSPKPISKKLAPEMT